jgi:cbb3-type cytochrome c oxidase subunit II
MSFWTRHQIFEKNSIVLIVGILAVIAIGGLVEITPLFYLKSTIEVVDGIRPYTPLELTGRNIYVREGCYLCHSAITRSPPRACTTTRSSGAPSAPARISRASALNIPTNGTSRI